MDKDLQQSSRCSIGKHQLALSISYSRLGKRPHSSFGCPLFILSFLLALTSQFACEVNHPLAAGTAQSKIVVYTNTIRMAVRIDQST
ncbi:MAG TPA: hypothetical protein V6C81_28210 [Planktothrix sp.]